MKTKVLKTSGIALCGCLAVAFAACGGDDAKQQAAMMAAQQAPQLAAVTAAPSSVTLDVKFPTTLQDRKSVV